MQNEPTPEKSDSIVDVTLTRRQMYGVLAGVAFGGGAALAAFTDIPERLSRQGLHDRIAAEIGNNRRSAVRTLIESTALWAGNMAICNFMDKKGIMHGTHAMEGDAALEFAENYPIRDFLHKNLMMPVLEEAVFRLLPSSLFCEEQAPNVKLHWDYGLAANAVFSVIHNFGSPEPGKFKFTLTSLPLEQFIFGAYCWYVQRKGGFVHSASAHILYNSLCDAYERLAVRAESDKLEK